MSGILFLATPKKMILYPSIHGYLKKPLFLYREIVYNICTPEASTIFHLFVSTVFVISVKIIVLKRV